MADHDSHHTDVLAASPIKVLDPLTQRYHGGRVHAACGGNLEVKLSATARLTPGLRIRYSMAETGFVRRHTMGNAVVTHVAQTDGAHLYVALLLEPESAAA